MARHFYGRHEELKALHDRLDTPGFQMVSVYGRRRVGKTTLINKFVEESGARVISYVALERDEREQLESLGETVLACLAPDLIGSVSFDSFEKIFDFVARHAAQERIIFLIDEYPYLAKECRHMNSLLQRYVDHEWATTQLYLVLCGSLVTFMRESVLGKGAPLHGRSTLELRLRPMDYLESASFVPNYTNEEKAIVYGLTGGVPKYLEQFDDDKPLDDNIASQLMAAGIHTLFTGHLHVTDAATFYNKERTDSLVEIATGSSICYPFALRVATLDKKHRSLDIDTRWLTATANCPTLREQGRQRILMATPGIAAMMSDKMWSRYGTQMNQLKRMIEAGNVKANFPETPQQATQLALRHLSEVLSRVMLAVVEGNEQEKDTQDIIAQGKQGVRTMIEEVIPSQADAMWEFFENDVYPRLEPMVRSILEDRNAVGTPNESQTNDLQLTVTL